ncbi:hypothetical protein EIN_473220 [Entamoeba invadens IP1]|uniref:Galactose-inhibitable lectin 35 kDa subunit n=1 Tax=Entamoeba invadens IP1 TaxID=370355 RepID=A0A0A1U694_ENTIV|nr:hypothetical protein EIN_473220 [Entamoeba invadens IP1]ELP89914.1 hypothetical protein EIN_473220 [Entamoeba invadens IP1]|eukprot:XP_004256685.1 hypothetical protein EIN_473220 [Entamoeba invadens IP1]
MNIVACVLILSAFVQPTLSFTSEYDSYVVPNPPYPNVYTANNENYVREKCVTCCRVLFASEYNYVDDRKFIDDDDRKGITRYVMDTEFDDKRSVRQYEDSWEQNILMRPLKQGNELQYWEFAPYKMYISFAIPRRVHDIRQGAEPGNTLIIWDKKPPLDIETKNQRFVYVHPYDGYPSTEFYSIYKQHFYIPFQTSYKLCYQTRIEGEKRSTWAGNKKLVVIGKSFQIKANYCDPYEPRQMFVPVFA